MDNRNVAAETFVNFTKEASEAVQRNVDEAAQHIKESIWKGSNPKIDTAKCYLLLAAMNVCEDALKTFGHYLSHPDADGAEYLALDGKKSITQVQQILEVMAELDDLLE